MNPNIAVILTDKDRKILWVNDAFTSITGYGLIEVKGKKPSLLQGANTGKATKENIRKNLEQQIPFKSEIINYRKNGEEYLCRLAIHPVFNEDNQITNFIAFEVDGYKVAAEDDPALLDIEVKYQASSLKGGEELKLLSKLRRAMEQEVLYLDPDLNLRDLSDHLKTNTKYLSQVINNHTGQNFHQFVNRYRMEAVKDKMVSGQHPDHTLFELAGHCGFKNKSTFYKVFKEFTGLTPRAYLKVNSKSIPSPKDQ